MTDSTEKGTAEKVKRRQGKADHAASTLEAQQARAAKIGEDHDEASDALEREKAALKAARKEAKQLGKKVEKREKLVESLRKERSAAEKQLSRHRDEAEKQLAKLAKVQAEVTAEDATSALEGGEAKAAVRTVKATSSRSAAAKTAAKKTTARKAPAKRAPAKKTSARKTASAGGTS